MLKKRFYILVMIISLVALLATACESSPSTTEPSTTEPSPQPSPTTTAPAPSVAAGDNFRFLISDDANAIDKFASVNVTITEIGMQSGGESGNWTTITPDITVVDLKPLIGENALEVWSGNLTPGEYNKVFIYVSEVTGILLEEHGGNAVDIKLPSDKLHISKPFTVSENATTAFVYDITVIEAGKSGKYNLKPQIAQSGAEQKFREVKQNGTPGEPNGEYTLEGTTWTLVSYGPSDNLTPVIEGTTVTIEFEGEEDGFSGTAGCNHYFGGYELDGETITVNSPIGATEMACMEPEGVMDQEQAYLSILQNMTSYSIEDAELTIFCGDDVLTFMADD